jgi:hypothetical protein
MAAFIVIIALIISVFSQGYETYKNTKNVFYNLAKSYYGNQRNMFNFKIPIGGEELKTYKSAKDFVNDILIFDEDTKEFEMDPSTGKVIGYVMVFFFL